MFMANHYYTETHTSQCINAFEKNNTKSYSEKMSKLVENILAEMQKRGWNQTELSKVSDVPQPTINRIIKREIKDPKSPVIEKIAAAFGQSEWELRGAIIEGQVIRQTLPGPIVPGPEFVPIHYGSFRLQAGVSGFSVDYQDEDYEPLFFRESWLLRERLKAENLTARKISGDSMAPGLNHDDTVLIDRSKNEPVDGKVFAVNYEGELVIKRLVRDAGQWWLASDNPDKTRYPNKLCSSELCLIIGQCVHKQSTMI